MLIPLILPSLTRIPLPCSRTLKFLYLIIVCGYFAFLSALQPYPYSYTVTAPISSPSVLTQAIIPALTILSYFLHLDPMMNQFNSTLSSTLKSLVPLPHIDLFPVLDYSTIYYLHSYSCAAERGWRKSQNDTFAT